MSTRDLVDEFQEAMTLHQRGNLAEAERRYRHLISLNPKNAAALHLLGVLYYQQAKPAEALPLIQSSLKLDPDQPASWSNCGEVLRALAKDREAELCYREALARAPEEASYWNNLGIALQEQEKKADAEAAFRKAISLKSDFVKAWYNLGNLLRLTSRLDEADTALETTLRLQPQMAEAWNNLGALRRKQKRLSDSEACYRKALAVRPGFPEALCNLANCLKDSGSLVAAEHLYRQALARVPHFAEAQSGLASTYREQGLGPEACAGYQRASELNPNNLRFLSNLLFTQAAYATGPEPEHLRVARTWGDRSLRPPLATRSPPPLSGRKLRVGYVSSDFQQHAISHFIEILLAAHDRSRVEVFAFPQVSAPDATTEAIKSRVDHWHPIDRLTDGDAARLIHSQGIDVLVDLNGHTRDSRLAVLGHKPAPVQIVYLGYFSTTGLSTVDYWITDDILHPADSKELAVENLWRLPRCWVAYDPPADAPLPAVGGHTRFRFGSYNHLAKMGPATLDLWAAVLRAAPHADLLLKTRHLGEAAMQDRIRAAFASRGVTPERLIFGGHTAGMSAHLQSYQAIDVALDTHPYSGGTTTCDALWMGVPVLTLAGQTMASRMSASMLTAIGCRDWIAHSTPEFVEKAVEMSATLARADPSARLERRRQLRDRVAASPLVDAKDLARALESAYAAMVDLAARRAATPSA